MISRPGPGRRSRLGQIPRHLSATVASKPRSRAPPQPFALPPRSPRRSAPTSSASSTGSTVSSQSSVCQGPITGWPAAPAAISRVTLEQRMCSDRMADMSGRLSRRLLVGRFWGCRALQQYRERGHVMGGRPLDRLEKCGVEHRDLTESAAISLRSPARSPPSSTTNPAFFRPERGTLTMEPICNLPREGDLGCRTKSRCRPRTSGHWGQREPWVDSETGRPLRASTMSRRSQENSGRPKCP